jgi:hypothetical protein
MICSAPTAGEERLTRYGLGGLLSGLPGCWEYSHEHETGPDLATRPARRSGSPSSGTMLCPEVVAELVWRLVPPERISLVRSACDSAAAETDMGVNHRV